jgi:hypothetical protein
MLETRSRLSSSPDNVGRRRNVHHRNQRTKRGRDDDDGDYGDGKDNNQRCSRLIECKDWGLKEVLAECGLVDFASSSYSSSSSTPHPRGDANERRGIGCRLEADVSSSTVRSSLYALLGEMLANGIDPGNERTRTEGFGRRKT